MGDIVTLTGMILTASPMKEYDRRIEILTKERGRISAFAGGARKAMCPLSACTIPFTYGKFTLYEGRNSYNLKSGEIEKYFATLSNDYELMCYGSYFAQMAQYFTRENMEAGEEIKLLYITFLALQKNVIPPSIVRIVYELKLLAIEGQGMEFFQCINCGDVNTRKVYFKAGGLLCDRCAGKEKELMDTYPYELSGDALYTIQYVLSTPVEKVFSFMLKKEVENELQHFMKSYLKRFVNHKFSAEDFLV